MPFRPGNYKDPTKDIGLELKERLVAWRAKYLYATLPDIEPFNGVSGRLWDITKPLFQVGILANPEGNYLLREAILSVAGERSETKKETTEGHIIGVIKDISAEKGLEELPDWQIRTSDILLKFNEGRPIDKYVSSQWIGKKLKSLSLRHRTVNGRSEILLESKEYWSLMEQYGCARRESNSEADISVGTLPEKDVLNCIVMHVVDSGRECHEPWDEVYESPPPSDNDSIYCDEVEKRAAFEEYEADLAGEEAERRDREEES